MAIVIRISWSVTFKNTINFKNRGLQFCKKAKQIGYSNNKMSHSLHLPLSTCLVQLNCGGSLCPPVPQHMHRYLLLSALKFSCCSQQYCSHFCLHALQLSSEQSLLCTLWEVCSMLPCANQPAGSLDGWEVAGRCVSSFLICLNRPFSPIKSI